MKSICYTSLRQAIKFILAALILIILAVGIFLWMLTIKPNIYDKNRKSGIPEALPEEFGYTCYQAQDICDVWICGNPYFDGKNVDFYVTNPTTNEGIAIRAEIYTVAFTRDENGNITGTFPDELLGRSGFIHAGEYIQTIKLDETLKTQTPVILKIGTYVEETEKSNGFFYITTMLTPQK